MKKREKSNLLLSIFVDFAFIVIAISLICGALFVAKTVLYPQKSFSGDLRIRTEYMALEYKGELRVGDSVFDTLTKRKVGIIKDLEVDQNSEGMRFFITLDANFKPRSKAMRTQNLWFYFAEADI